MSDTPRTDVLLNEAPSTWSLTYASSLIKLCRELERENSTLVAALEFYANPFGKSWQVPELYDEMEFGNVASAALAIIAK